jgi:hypothetical protein
MTHRVPRDETPPGHLRPAAPSRRRAAALALAALPVLWLSPQLPAHAVFTTVLVGSNPQSLTLQVGGTTGIDNVVFNVNGSNVSPSPAPVTNAAAVDFRITANRVNSGFQPYITLTADSTTGLACVSGTGCGSTVIPFSAISWTSTNSAASGLDIQNGAFNGSATQQLARYQNNYSVCSFFLVFCWGYAYYDTNMYNALLFTYANSTLYPAGQYKGRVTFTATML